VDGVPEHSVILIAAATGVTQMRSIALWLLAQPEAPTVSLFWGTLTPEELYLSDEFESLAASNQRFQYCPVVSQSSSAWHGRQGLVVNAAIEDCEDLSSADIYISGSPTMVYGTLDRLVEQGVDADRVSADVFDYAPRQ
jgi:CDP-4-dehydro-6-deoxyglucose reductase